MYVSRHYKATDAALLNYCPVAKIRSNQVFMYCCTAYPMYCCTTAVQYLQRQLGLHNVHVTVHHLGDAVLHLWMCMIGLCFISDLVIDRMGYCI